MSQASFEASLRQAQLWDREPEGPSGRVQPALRVDGVDPAAIRTALAATVARHEILRTTFARQPGLRVPVQVIHDELAPAWRELDLSELAADEQLDALQRARAEELRAPVDFSAGPVVRALLAVHGPSAHTLVLTFTALHFDYMSVAALLDEFAAHLAGSGAVTPEPLQYADFAAWQGELAGAQDDEAAAARAFWAARHDGGATALPFTTQRSDPFAPEEIEIELSGEVEQALRARAPHAPAQDAWLQATWQATLARASASDQVTIAVPGPLTLDPDLAGAIGPFGWPLALRTEFGPHAPFNSVLLALQQERECAAAHQHQAAAGLPPGVTAGFIASPAYELSIGSVTLSLQRVATTVPELRLWLACDRGGGGGLALRLAYDSGHLPTAQARRLAGQFERLLAAFLADPTLPYDEPDLLTASDRRRLVVDFNRTATRVPDLRVHELVAEQAATHPDRVAAVDRHGALTYRELDRRANQLAHRLRSAGVSAGATVGLFAESSGDTVVGLLGIMKAGGAYVPLHPDHPPARLSSQLRAAGARAIVSPGAPPSDLHAFDGEILRLDRDGDLLDTQPPDAPDTSPRGDDLAYVIFTSGSSGEPKGVGVTHDNLVNYAADIVRRLGADREPLAFGLVTSISTDLGNTSVYGALCSGGTLVLIDAVTAADPAALSRRLRESPVDVLKITPSHLAALVAGEDAGVLPARWLVLGGERAPWDLVERVRRLSAVAIMNHYGPTETTVGCCAMAVDGPGPWAPRSVPIGRPLANTACYVLDARQRLVDIGLPGRLFVGGAGVARGYVGQDALTAQRFVPNPFSAQGELAQTRMYDTGDLARWLPDGTLEFLGRVDDQIKIRGYRVEPGEVESALRAHPLVRDAVVVAADDGGAPRLVAYAVSAPPASSQDLRLHLQTLLPDQMVPSAIALMAELPRTASGKIDRRALPDPATIAVEPEGPYVAPSTPVEEAIAAVWAEVLAVERVSATDDFFALGGHSLLATHVVAQLRSDFAVDLPLYALFVSPTVQTLADEVQRLLAEDPGDGSPTGGDLAAAGDA